MKRILLMYISDNSGHHRAVKAIEEALLSQSSNIKVMSINCFNYTNPILEKVINNIYNKVIKLKPEVWEYLYDNPKVVRRTRKLRKLIHKFNSIKLKKLINNFKPDAVLCSQAFPCGMIADLKKTKNLHFPLVGVLTDYAPHSYWIYDNVDAYIVPSEGTKRKFIDSGIKSNRIFNYGIPVSPQFSQSIPKDDVLKSLELEPGVPTILIMGGGQGLGPIEELMFALNTIESEFQMIVVCGINKKLKKWLDKRKLLFRKNMAVLGYSKDVNLLMDAADLIVSKPGGLTTAEALTKGLPIVVVNPIPGQEAMNTAFLLEEGVAVKAKDPLHSAILIDDLLKNPEKLEKMRKSALRHAKPDSAEMVAKQIFRLMGEKA